MICIDFYSGLSQTNSYKTYNEDLDATTRYLHFLFVFQSAH